jgi:hypothetical protein
MEKAKNLAANVEPYPMRAFEVHVNGTKLCLAGVTGHGVLSAILSSVSGERGADLFLHGGGLVSLTQEHVDWIGNKPLSIGDEIRVKIVEAAFVDDPISRRTPDSAKEAQKAYVRSMAKRLGLTTIEDPKERA